MGEFFISNLEQFWQLTGFANATWEHFVMLAVGQPTHAFDRTHVKGEKIIVRNADALTLASVKLKDTFNDNTDYFKLEEEQGEIEEE